MPCPTLQQPLDFPKYLLNIFKEVDIGKDENLKKCNCKLHIPYKKFDTACKEIIYQFSADKRYIKGGFPFCNIKYSENDPSVGPGTQYPIRLTLEQAMNLYWNSKYFTNNFSAITSWGYSLTYPCPDGAVCSGGGSDSESWVQYGKIQNICKTNETLDPNFKLNEQKELICPGALYLLYDYDHALGSCSGCTPGGPSCYETKSKEFTAGMSLFEADPDLPQLKIVKKNNIYWFYPRINFFLSKYGLYVSNDPSLLETDPATELPTLPLEEVSVGFYFNDEKLDVMKLYVLKFGNGNPDCPGDFHRFGANFSMGPIKIQSWPDKK